jgi:hypothetical protein
MLSIYPSLENLFPNLAPNKSIAYNSLICKYYKSRIRVISFVIPDQVGNLNQSPKITILDTRESGYDKVRNLVNEMTLK